MMPSGTSTAFGEIKELGLQENKYRLVIASPVPFHTKTLSFDVCDSNLLQNHETNNEYNIGDRVKVRFHPKDRYSNFLQLDNISLACFDSCSLCYSAIEVTETLQIDCPACRNIPLKGHRERINEPMRLISCSKKFYLYSVGYRIELLPENEDLTSVSKPFVCVILPYALLYSSLRNLKIDCVYNVTAWRNGTGRLLDLLEICWFSLSICHATYVSLYLRPPRVQKGHVTHGELLMLKKFRLLGCASSASSSTGSPDPGNFYA